MVQHDLRMPLLVVVVFGITRLEGGDGAGGSPIGLNEDLA